MKRNVFSLLILLCVAAGHAQSKVEQVCSALEEQTLFVLDDWKLSRNVEPEAAASDFDDEAWRTIKLRERFAADSAWMRKTFTVPEKILGQNIKGPVILKITVDDWGILYSNGERIDRFNWDGSFTLTQSVRPGEVFSLAVKAVNTGGPMRLMNARLEFPQMRDDLEDVENFIESLRISEALLNENPYPKTDKKRWDLHIDLSQANNYRRSVLRQRLDEAVEAVDINALRSGNILQFQLSLVNARGLLRSIGQYAKEFTLALAANAHIDCAWLWRYLETINISKNTFTSVLQMMDARPDFTYSQSQAHLYWWMETFYPHILDNIRNAITRKRWEVVGGMWVEPDCNLISGESWARQLLYGKRYFQQRLGVDVTIGWNPDSFGYNWNMPQFYRDAGIDAFITQKLEWNDTNVFPFRLFWWQGPDGRRILTYFPFNYSDDLQDGVRLNAWLRQFEANTGMKKMLVLFGVGDHGGGPTMEMLEQVERFKKLDVFPTVSYSSASDYLTWIRTNDLKNLPVWKDELYLEYHRGTATTQANTKKNNRECEILLAEAEQVAAFASLSGRTFSQVNFFESWRGVMFNQFHDILPGSGIHAVYKDADELYENSRSIARYELNASLDHLANGIDVPYPGQPIIIYNPLPWDRTDLVELYLPEGDMQIYNVYDDQNRITTTQTVARTRVARKLLFIAEQVPAMGYVIYTLRPSDIGESLPFIREGESSIENNYFRIEMDTREGWIKQIWDKRAARDVLVGPGNELQLFRDMPSAWDAWEIDISDRYPANFRGLKVVEKGPVRLIVRSEHDFLKPGEEKAYPTPNNPNSYFTQDVILYNHLDRIEFVTHADWWEDHVAMKVGFTVNARDTSATYEIPFGSIRRTTQRRTDWQLARHEVNMHKWCDLTHRDGRYGISLLNRAKYGGDITDNVMRLTLLRSPTWPDPLADRGKHDIEYALYPHTGDWKSSGTMHKAYEYNYPLIARLVNRSSGTKPMRHSFATTDAKNVILHTIKVAEPDFIARASDDRSRPAWILRLFEFEGKSTKIIVTMPQTIRKAMISDIMEQEGESVSAFSNKVKMDLEPYQIVTLKIFYQ
ncbi:alpha-mannosidase [candidate division KSB1 bacterium]|nr:alpha-mannosidase [candidate division KSB1 bacterium]